MFKVIYHVDTPEKWKLTIDNVNNMLKEGKNSGDDFEIEILANSSAVINLKEQIAVNSKLYMKMSELSEQNVQFRACNNSINTLDINPKDLCSFVKVVPSGVVELAKKQSENYSYIKP